MSVCKLFLFDFYSFDEIFFFAEIFHEVRSNGFFEAQQFDEFFKALFSDENLDSFSVDENLDLAFGPDRIAEKLNHGQKNLNRKSGIYFLCKTNNISFNLSFSYTPSFACDKTKGSLHCLRHFVELQERFDDHYIETSDPYAV